MEKTVYIETSVVSYMAADRSENIRVAGHQLATYEVWQELPAYRVFVSDTVVEEASAGNTDDACYLLT